MGMGMKTLEDALASFDGKATTILTEIRAAFGDSRSFVSDLVRLAAHDEAHVRDGATWLIKALLDDGIRLTPSQTDDLIGRLSDAPSWQSQLHLSQSIRHLEIPEHLAEGCADWLTPLLHNDRPFLRAWSMDALQHLVRSDPNLAGRAETALSVAEQDPAASVRARARACRKQANAP